MSAPKENSAFRKTKLCMNSSGICFPRAVLKVLHLYEPLPRMLGDWPFERWVFSFSSSLSLVPGIGATSGVEVVREFLEV